MTSWDGVRFESWAQVCRMPCTFAYNEVILQGPVEIQVIPYATYCKTTIICVSFMYANYARQYQVT